MMANTPDFSPTGIQSALHPDGISQQYEIYIDF